MLPHMIWKKGALHLLKHTEQFKIPFRLTAAVSNLPKEQSNERDLINFPVQKRLETPIETRLSLPKTWFDAFYYKTGVTGPYMLIGGLGTYIFSKEIVVINGEFLALLAVLLIYPAHKYLLEKSLLPYLEKEYEKTKESLDAPRKETIDLLEQTIKSNNSKEKEMEVITSNLPNVKRENVYLQMEAAYREQLKEVYDKVKSRLDYHIEKQNVERRIAQKNMVDWISRHVMDSITPQLMNNALKQSIADIKTLATKA